MWIVMWLDALLVVEYLGVVWLHVMLLDVIWFTVWSVVVCSVV